MKKQRTKPTKQSEITRDWHVIDVKDKVLGHVAGEIALLLRGKRKPYFVPNLDCGDEVVVVNAIHVYLSGNKEQQKEYTRYSGYPGGQRRENVAQLRARKPEEIVRRAVSGMLPKNKLRDQWLSRLHIYANEAHPHEKQISS